MTVTRWHGDAILTGIAAAAAAAIDETTAAAAEGSQEEHWWQNQSGQLQEETVSEPAKPVGAARIEGKFGTTKRRGFYGLFLEIEEPFLHPIADQVFPTLPVRLAAKVAELKLL